MAAVPVDEPHGYFARQPGAVDSAFAVLETVAQLGAGVTARQLVDALPLSRATVYRILKHLVAHEYLVLTPDLHGFALGARLRVLGMASHRDSGCCVLGRDSTAGGGANSAVSLISAHTAVMLA